MTTTKHTPGPWYVGDINIDPDEGVLGEVAIMARTDSGITGVYCPAVALPFGSSKGPEIAMANARLISASPDLFAFAECSAAMDCATYDPRFDLKPAFRSHGWNGEESPAVFLARIRRSALEKAVGHYLGRTAA